MAEVFVAEAAEKAWETNKKLTKESLVLAGQAKTILARFKENVNHSILGDQWCPVKIMPVEIPDPSPF